MDVARYRLEHNIEFSVLSEKGKKYFNLEVYPLYNAVALGITETDMMKVVPMEDKAMWYGDVITEKK